jgi:hypothetical protein
VTNRDKISNQRRGDKDVAKLNRVRSCGKGGVGGMRYRQLSTVSKDNGGVERMGGVEITG